MLTVQDLIDHLARYDPKLPVVAQRLANVYSPAVLVAERELLVVGGDPPLLLLAEGWEGTTLDRLRAVAIGADPPSPVERSSPAQLGAPGVRLWRPRARWTASGASQRWAACLPAPSCRRPRSRARSARRRQPE